MELIKNMKCLKIIVTTKYLIKYGIYPLKVQKYMNMPQGQGIHTVLRDMDTIQLRGPPQLRPHY